MRAMVHPRTLSSVPTTVRPHEDTPVLTVTQVLSFKRQVEEDERLLAELPVRITEGKKRLEAALMFLTETQREAIFGDDYAHVSDGTLTLTAPEPQRRYQVQRSDGTPTWTGSIMEVLTQADSGLTHVQIMDLIKATGSEIAVRLEEDTKRYYASMAKLEKRKEVVRHNGLFYAQILFEELKRQGVELPNLPEPEQAAPTLKANTSAWFIYRCLSEADEGLTVAELKQMLSGVDGVAPALYESSSFIFNVLKLMQERGLVEKGETTKKYFAIQKAKPRGNGASITNASEAAR